LQYILIANFNLENPGIWTPKSQDFGIGKRAGHRQGLLMSMEPGSRYFYFYLWW